VIVIREGRETERGGRMRQRETEGEEGEEGHLKNHPNSKLKLMRFAYRFYILTSYFIS